MHGHLNVKLDRGLKQQTDISNMDLSTNQFGKTVINTFVFRQIQKYFII